MCERQKRKNGDWIKRYLLAVIVVLCLMFTACESADTEKDTGKQEQQSVAEQVQDGDSEEDEDASQIQEDAAWDDSNPSSETKAPIISLEDIPEFTGKAYVEVNGNVPYFTDAEKTTKVFENYSKQDSLGRCGVAYANICQELMPTEERGPIGMVKPAGWHTVKYNGVVDGNYLYNRCHLIGFQLAGENANEDNLITGTRYMNVDGMLPFENFVADYVDWSDNHVLYRVTPVYDGDNLIANGVLIEAYSVEDQGEGVSFNVFCYNVQSGITIDYATGDSRLTEGSTVSNEETAPVTNPDVKKDYVLNKNTKKFHLPGCGSVGTIKPKNREDYSGSREELINRGYDPCKRCNP